MKRVLMLNYEYPPLGGGAANATAHILKEFAGQDDVRIDLVTSGIGKDRQEKIKNNITIHFLDIQKRGDIHYQSSKDLLMYSWRAYWKAKSLIRNQQFDLVHAFFGIPCGYIAMRLGLPYIVSLRGSDVPFYNERFRHADKLIFQSLSRKIWARASKVIANSKGLKELAHKTSDRQIEVIPNGVDTEKFKPAVNHRSRQNFISTCRLIERKGVLELLEAFIEVLKTHPRATLTFIGAGNLRKQMIERVARLGLQESIKFPGVVDHRELPNHYQDADIFILPSKNEGMSNSLLEAMASGLPVIVTDTGGTEELVSPSSGFIINRVTEAEMAVAIEKLQTWSQMGQLGRRKVEQLSWKNTSDDYQEVYLAI